MQKIPKYLLEEIVSFTTGLTEIDQFQKWLYEQEDLVKKIVSDNFIYELFSLNYNQKEVRHELKKIAVNVIGEEHFRVYQIKKSLEAILNNKGDLYALLNFFNSLCGYEGYEFLSNLGWCYYVVGEYNEYEVSFPSEVKEYYIQESCNLLEKVDKKMKTGCQNVRCLEIEKSAPPTFGLPYHLYNSRSSNSLTKKLRRIKNKVCFYYIKGFKK